jgi:hypothetical protein
VAASTSSASLSPSLPTPSPSLPVSAFTLGFILSPAPFLPDDDTLFPYLSFPAAPPAIEATDTVNAEWSIEKLWGTRSFAGRTSSRFAYLNTRRQRPTVRLKQTSKETTPDVLAGYLAQCDARAVALPPCPSKRCVVATEILDLIAPLAVGWVQRVLLCYTCQKARSILPFLFSCFPSLSFFLFN